MAAYDYSIVYVPHPIAFAVDFSTFTTCILNSFFLQRGRIACKVERCNTDNNSIRLSVRPSVCHTLVPYPE